MIENCSVTSNLDNENTRLRQRVAELEKERDDYKQALNEIGVTPGEARKGAERSRAKTEQITALTVERDEADRRAGAAERAYKSYLDAAVARDSWLRKAKAQWGADSSISFDVVWSEALALKEQITTLTADLELAKHNNEAHDRELERVIAERDKATQYWQIAEGRCDALQKDADRYRWLRMHTDWFDWDIVVQPHLPADHPAHDYSEVKIDCAIDFVMGNLK